MIKKIFSLLILFLLTGQSVYPYSLNEGIIPYQIYENQLFEFAAVPNNVYEITFNPPQTGKWQIEISHNTKLLEYFKGYVVYAIIYDSKVKNYVIEGEDEIRFKETNPVILIKEDSSPCFKIFISNGYELNMDIEIYLTPTE